MLRATAEVFTPPLRGLFADHGAPVAFHRCVVGGDQLRRHHVLQFDVAVGAGRFFVTAP
jgi:hypothetical protein